VTKQLLVYSNVAPISSERHANWFVEDKEDYEYTQGLNFVPILTAEFAQVSINYPIVFAMGDTETPMPVAILSIEKGINCYLNDNNQWDSEYVPAFLRRYPFVFTRSQDEQEYYLSIDEDYKGFNQEEKGHPLFNDEKEPGNITKEMLSFSTQYQIEHTKTLEFCSKLHELNLFDRKQVSSAGQDEKEEIKLSGFYTVDRTRISTLRESSILELVQDGSYEKICNHLSSLENFSSTRFARK
jgi:hypothetical protein